MPDSTFADNRRLASQPTYLYERRNHRLARVVYRSSLVQRLFGPGAAQVFMGVMGVDPVLARRVTSAPREDLRR